ncbi:MAG: hypothetical protein WCB53_08775 [Terriglobales bacterium]
MQRKMYFECMPSATGSTRWLAVATVSVTAAATLTASGGFLLTIPLALGVIAESHSPRRGRWLMWVGAVYLSATLLQMQIRIVPEFIAELRSYHRLGGLGPIVFPLSIASILLIVWCDVALLIDALKTSRSRTAPGGGCSSTMDVLIWITALCFSVYSFAGIPFLLHAFSHGFDRPDILLTGSALILIAIVFDVALVIDAARTFHAGRAGATSQ